MMRMGRISAALLIMGLWVGVFSCTQKEKQDPPNTIYAYEIEKIKTLDPAFTDDHFSARMAAYSYDSLYQYHYLKRPYEVIPNLAEEMPKISTDGKTYLIKLKKGVVFQDDPSFKSTDGKGREIEAADIIYSFKRLADPQLDSTGWWTLDGKIAGLNEWRKAAIATGSANYGENVKGLKVVDKYTLEIELNSPNAQFLYVLTMPFTSIVSKEAVEYYGKDFYKNPVGTGPFIFDKKNSNLSSQLIWTKNPTFREEFFPSEGTAADKKNGLLADAGKPLPFAERVVIQIFTESQPQWTNFIAGKIDYSNIPKDNFEGVIAPTKDLTVEMKKRNIQLLKETMLDVTRIGFNMEDPILSKNKLLRQAMNLAFDSHKFIELFYNGRALPAQSVIPPGVEGYDALYRNPYRSYNLEKAKELLSKAGYPDGKGLPPLTYMGLQMGTDREAAEYFQRSMDRLGIKVELEEYSYSEFVKRLRSKQAQVIGLQAWLADYPDAENFLMPYYSKNYSPGPNDVNYVSAEFDRLYEQIKKVKEPKRRVEIYRKAVKVLAEDSPILVNAHRIQYTVVQPWLRNFKIHEFDWNRAKYLAVDLNLKPH